MTALSPASYSFIIGDKTPLSAVITPVLTQVPACGYTYTLATLNVPVSLMTTPSATTITIFDSTRDLSLAGVYSVTVTATLIEQTFAPAS
jgi:hypothetical protein